MAWSDLAEKQWRLGGGALCIALAFVSGTALAFDSLSGRLPSGVALTRIFEDGEARADVKDGWLLGVGHERTVRLQDGRMRIERVRTYTRVVHPETRRTVKLPKPWKARSRLLVSPALRLLEADTSLEFHRSIDDVLDGYRFTEEHERYFEFDRIRTRAAAAGRQLTRTTSLAGKRVETESYDYPSDAIPLEIVGIALAAAVQERIDRFDFDLLVPGGSTHGVRSIVHRTRDASHFGDGYRLPRDRLRSAQEMAVVEMRLASPVKYVFFPHKFFMAYESARPDRLLALWGGDPDEHMQAFRKN